MCTLGFFRSYYKLKSTFNFFKSTEKITISKNGERDCNNKACFIMHYEIR